MSNPTVGFLINDWSKNFSSQLAKSDLNALFSSVMGVNYETLFSFMEKELTKTQMKQLKAIEKRLMADEPLAYILKKKYFYNHELIVDRGVLIPREDSEILISEAIDFLEKKYLSKAISVVDLCTGTGALGLTLASLRKQKDVYYLTDVDSLALKNVQKNLKLLELEQKDIRILKANYLSVFEEIPKANLIICNPPYLDKNDFKISKSTKKFEPELALYAQNSGYYFYEILAKEFSKIMDFDQPWMILMEFGFEQKARLEGIFSNLPENVRIDFLKDYKGNWRVVKLYNI